MAHLHRLPFASLIAKACVLGSVVTCHHTTVVFPIMVCVGVCLRHVRTTQYTRRASQVLGGPPEKARKGWTVRTTFRASSSRETSQLRSKGAINHFAALHFVIGDIWPLRCTTETSCSLESALDQHRLVVDDEDLGVISSYLVTTPAVVVTWGILAGGCVIL